AQSFQIYASKVRQITTDLLRGELMASDTSNPMLIRRPVQKSGYIVITSDSGLKGSYNSSILKAVMGMIEQDHDSKDEYEIIAIGSMGADFFRARGINPVFELRGLADNPSF
ncbi:F0F1 ATP synthase subunit gamma, partial [Streptococcus suis]